MSNFIIRDKETLKEKMDLIQSLIDIQIAHKIVETNIKEDKEENLVDQNYAQLKCKIRTMNSSETMYQKI